MNNNKLSYQELEKRVQELEEMLAAGDSEKKKNKNKSTEYESTENEQNILNNNEVYKSINKEIIEYSEQLYQAKNIIEERENLIIQITDKIPVFIALVNNDLEYLLVNEGYARFFNLEKKDIIGKKVKDIIGKVSFKIANQYLNKALKGQIVSFENFYHFDNDVPRIVQTNYTPYYHNKKIEGVIVCISDITDQKKANLALENSEEKFRLLIKNSSDIIVLLNQKAEQIFISDAIRKLTGYSPEELKGPIDNFIFQEDLDIVKQHISKVLSDNNADYIQYRHKHKENEYVWFEAIFQNFLNHPAINALVVNIRDITERKKTEELLRISEATQRKLLLLQRNIIFNELVSNQKNLASASLKLIQNSEKDATTLEQLINIEKNTNSEGRRVLNHLISYYKRTSVNSNWQEFELLFEKVHHTFYERLNTQFPTLTANERRICAFLKLNMSNKEIGKITLQSDEALKKARMRLRQKLKIERDVNMNAFLQNI